MDDLIKLLKTVELFEGLSDEQLRRLAEISREERYERGDEIFAQGDEGDKVYIIRRGQVEVVIDRRSGAPRSQIYLGQGQIFGEMALVDMGPRSATVRCIRDGTVLDVIKRGDFIRLCEEDTAIGYIVMRNMAADLSFKLRHYNLAQY